LRYEVRFKPAAAKELAKLPADVLRRIAPRIDALASNPRPHGVEKLAGEDAWRIRVGDFRVVYTIEDRVLVVLVIHIGNRREVYKRLRRGS
jgi:mRNA interferase RelE/StbE